MPLEKLVAQRFVTAVMSCGHTAVPQTLIVVQLLKVFTVEAYGLWCLRWGDWWRDAV
jgi:hypothetical protein